MRVSSYKYSPSTILEENMEPSVRITIAELLSNGTKLSREQILNDIRPELKNCRIDASIEVTIMKFLENPPKEPRISKLGEVMTALFPEVSREVGKAYSDATDMTEWTAAAQSALSICLADTTEGSRLGEQARRDIIQSIITYYVWVVQKDQKSAEKWYLEGGL